VLESGAVRPSVVINEFGAVLRVRPKSADDHQIGNRASPAPQAEDVPYDIGGHYRPDESKCAAVMRPSATLNATLNAALASARS
jgi:hypothetical protein